MQEFDAGGELVRRVDPDGAVRSWAYRTSDPGFTWTDPTGREVVVDADPAGLPIAVTDAAGTARVVRDELGRIVELIDPVGAATGLTWSVQGWLLGRRDATLAEETWRYDGRGNLVEAVDASGRVTRYDYGPFDVLTRRLAPDGGVVRLAYDEPDNRPAVVCDDVETLRLEGLQAQAEQNTATQIVLKDTRDALITGCTSAAVEAFVTQTGKCEDIRFLNNDVDKAKSPLASN